MLKDTLNLLKRYFRPLLNERGEVGTPLPEAMAQDADLSGITTVEDLVTNLKEARTKVTPGVIPEDIKADPVFEKYKTPEDIARALVASQKFLGREKLPVPVDANDKEAHDIIYKRLGLPKDENGYVTPTDLQLPKDLPVDEALIANFKKTAHGLSILPQQFAGLYKWYMNSMGDAFNKMNEDKVTNAQTVETDLRTKWGAAYPQKIALAKKVFSSYVDEKMFAEFDKGLGNNPIVLEFLANIGVSLSEDQLTGKPSGLTMTPGEAQSEIDKMNADIKGPLYDNAHPQHQEYVEKRDRLYKFLTPSG